MNPYANLYLKVHEQYANDLARTYKHAQRGWAHSDFPNQGEYRPVRKSRVAAAWRRLGRRQSPVNPVTRVSPLSPVNSVSGDAADAGARRHAA
jgi:hypothetical protein